MTGQPVVIGAGGHAKVIVDILQDAGFEPAGCISADSSAKDVWGVPVLGGDEELPRLFAAGIRMAFVAIGDNAKRMKISGAVRELGFQLINAISPHAVVSRHAVLGRGIAVMPGAVINAGAQIGDGAIVNTGATVDHDCVVGNFAHVAPGANLAGCVRLGTGAFLGTGSCAFPDISVGSWTTVGAGGVIIRNLPERVVAIGVPAVAVKTKERSDG